MSNNFPCLKDHCYSPIACGAFGYCREHNFDFSDSINECYRAVKERTTNGGPGWPSKTTDSTE